MKAMRALRGAMSHFVADDALTLGAALAFYAAWSLAPVLVILLVIGGLMGVETRARMIDTISATVGQDAGQAIALVVKSVHEDRVSGVTSAIIGVITLVIGATTVFAQLQYSLNRLWGVQVKPGRYLWDWVRKRVLSFALVVTIALLLLASVVLTAALRFIVPKSTWGWTLTEIVGSVLIFGALFSLIFKFLPDVNIRWREALWGGAATAALFTAGRYAFAEYLAFSSVASAYGAAGSLVVLLMWVYYSSLSVFLGAELTEAFAREFGREIQPSRHAEWIHPPPEKH